MSSYFIKVSGLLTWFRERP